ncbi:NADH-quinone oxidoreductase subunit A [Nocardioides perillae]|uniref:NADH-quinone oxidoreductase subunit n=1 Tax=Nocardioides perillae TaxID=1119534 RepID=A0A7Y9RRM6_9ACTN|nr:NADH-quinone oxidoreductase subunit A [Nocardioides perillae]NYG55311.1 NADH-quinone oxidoreductase subunit A [Nocardioides perillae]
MYTGIAIAGATALLVVLGTYGIQRLLTVASDPLIVLPFDSGAIAEQHALSRYHARWYLATLLFLAFDVEMLFMYPWAVVVAQVGATAVVEMFLFLAALFVAVLWAWREGALRWV